jgi:hypothetical protein
MRASRVLAESMDLSGVLDMKTLHIVAICAAALIAGQASAQDNAAAPHDTTPPAAQDVAGTSQMTGSDSGYSMRITRQQVYDELVRSQQSGEQERLRKELYFGGN